MKTENAKKLHGIFSALCVSLLFAFCLVLLAGCRLLVANEYMTYNDTEYTLCGASLSTRVEIIYVDWVCGDVSVEVSDTVDYVSFYESSDKVNVQGGDFALRYRVFGNQLYVRFAKSRASLKGNPRKELSVTIPDKLIDFVKIENVSGGVSVRGASVEKETGTEFRVETVSGGVSFLNVNARDVGIVTVSGNVSVTSCVFAVQEKINTVSGDVEIWFGPQKVFVCTFNTVSGKVDNHIEATKIGNVFSYGTGEQLPISVDTVSGNLKLLLIPVYA